MKRILPLLLLLLLVSYNLWAQSNTWKTLQVTLGASATQITASSTTCVVVVVQNNATHNVTFGDNTITASKGVLLTPGASLTLYSTKGVALSQYYLFGTQNDVIDVGCQQPS